MDLVSISPHQIHSFILRFDVDSFNVMNGGIVLLLNSHIVSAKPLGVTSGEHVVIISHEEGNRIVIWR